MDEIVIGIISGLVTGCLIWFFQAIWLKILEPKIENYLYSDVRIDGIWTGELIGAESVYKEEITVFQKGHRITGMIKCIEGEDKGHAYNFEGTFRNLILTGSYFSVLASAVDRGTFTLKLRNNGTALRGHSAYYGDTGDEIISLEYQWMKDSR